MLRSFSRQPNCFNMDPDGAKPPQKYICKYIKIIKLDFAESSKFSRRLKGKKYILSIKKLLK
jgi:hypothetical protein